jgi:hypothetical protein
MMQMGHSPRVEEIALSGLLRHVSAIDHEGNGSALVGDAPARPKVVKDTFVHNVFNTLMHGHWLQGTLQDWRSESASAAIVDDIERLFPFTHPQWVNV